MNINQSPTTTPKILELEQDVTPTAKKTKIIKNNQLPILLQPQDTIQ